MKEERGVTCKILISRQELAIRKNKSISTRNKTRVTSKKKKKKIQLWGGREKKSKTL